MLRLSERVRHCWYSEGGPNPETIVTGNGNNVMWMDACARTCVCVCVCVHVNLCMCVTV